jgi:CDP-diacylglycerol---glycerol-3-phosphate 3-phosphatidyltransferase
MGAAVVTSGRDHSGAVWTIANAVTAVRILMAPLVIVLVAEVGPNWGLFLLFGTLAWSDVLDGYLARRQGPSRAGAFLDPLADKVLVLGTLFALVSWGAFTWVPVTVIAVREVVISVYRSVVGRHGISVPARPLAKLKTLLQLLAAGLALAPPVAREAAWLPRWLLWVAVVLTVVSGAQYLLDAQGPSRAVVGPARERGTG